jgi:hypothetical protein
VYIGRCIAARKTRLRRKQGRVVRDDLGPIWTDLPDHPGARDLHQGRVGAVLEPGIGIGASEIANGDVSAAIGTEANVSRPVEPADAVWESLIKCLVVREPLQV